MSTMHVNEVGQGTPILWIHGFPLSSRIFEPQLAIPGVRHLVPDLPGFGRSEPADIGSIDEYAAAVIALLDERRLSRSVVAGVSMGGYVAFSIVRQRPALASGLILIDTRETPDSPEARENRHRQVGRVDSEGTGFLVEEMLPKMLTSETIDLGDERSEIVRHAMESASPSGVKAALRAMASRPDSAPTLRSFHGPALIAAGDRDEITPLSDAQRMAALCPNARVVTIENAAHLSNVEQPAALNAAVSAFLDRLP